MEAVLHDSGNFRLVVSRKAAYLTFHDFARVTCHNVTVPSLTLFDGLNDLEAFEFRMPDKECAVVV